VKCIFLFSDALRTSQYFLFISQKGKAPSTLSLPCPPHHARTHTDQIVTVALFGWLWLATFLKTRPED